MAHLIGPMLQVLVSLLVAVFLSWFNGKEYYDMFIQTMLIFVIVNQWREER